MKEEKRRESFLPARHCCGCKFLFSRGKRERRNGRPHLREIRRDDGAAFEPAIPQASPWAGFINTADRENHATGSSRLEIPDYPRGLAAMKV